MLKLLLLKISVALGSWNVLDLSFRQLTIVKLTLVSTVHTLTDCYVCEGNSEGMMRQRV